jgi:hypothetical protein
MDEDTIRALVVRLSRAHPSGGAVIERAAIMAEGADFHAVVGWIVAHDGQPEAKAAKGVRRGGLHGTRPAKAASPAVAPLRYVLPAAALARPAGLTAD